MYDQDAAASRYIICLFFFFSSSSIALAGPVFGPPQDINDVCVRSRDMFTSLLIGGNNFTVAAALFGAAAGFLPIVTHMISVF